MGVDVSEGSSVVRSIRNDEPNYDRAVTEATMITSGLPCHRSIVAVDIENSTSRINSVKEQLRYALYELTETALQQGGIAKHHRDDLIDRGDGVFTLIHPVDQASKVLLLTSVIPMLSQLLADHDARHPDQQFRLRAVVHAGEVHYDRGGCFGEALDITFR